MDENWLNKVTLKFSEIPLSLTFTIQDKSYNIIVELTPFHSRLTSNLIYKKNLVDSSKSVA